MEFQIHGHLLDILVNAITKWFNFVFKNKILATVEAKSIKTATKVINDLLGGKLIVSDNYMSLSESPMNYISRVEIVDNEFDNDIMLDKYI